MQTYFGTDPTPIINYTPQTIDEYIVVVNLPEDWKEVHEYIINENEIDGIPNRKVNCSNDQPFSLRTAIYEMSVAEAEILKTHNKVECVELNPEKYPQPESLDIARFGNVVQFNKPVFPAGTSIYTPSSGTTNGVRSNWALLSTNHPSSEPFKGGNQNFDAVDKDVQYAIKGNNVDAVIIDTGVSVLHPEFIGSGGDYRVRDVILDGPMKADPAAFSGYTETVTIDGVNIGTRAQEARARSWWSNTSVRSSAFQSLGTISITSSYTRIHAHSKNGTNAVTNSHGTSCASQIGGKHHGFAFECNLWNIRIALGSAGGLLSSSVAVNACKIWHQAKKIASNDPDPTVVSCSFGGSYGTSNDSSTTYYHTYRGSNTTYTGTGNNFSVPSGHGTSRCAGYFKYRNGATVSYIGYSVGNYLAPGSSTSSAAENAISEGCIVLASAGNNNQKLSDKDDVDFNNKYYGTSSSYSGGTFLNRVGGIQQGFSGDHEQGKGTIRVGAIDCGVEPTDEQQGVPKNTIRKVAYSSNGPMVDIYAPAEKTHAASYASSEDYTRVDNSSFHDTFFGGTSSACPNTAGVVALFLEKNRSANQDDVRSFLTNEGCKTGLLSDPFPGVNDTGYFNIAITNTPTPFVSMESYNTNGSGNLRGSPNRTLFNYLSSSIDDNSLILKISGGTLNISGTLDISSMNIS